MKERKETINIVTANVVSIGILLISAIVLYAIFFMVYDSRDWFNEETRDSMVDNFGTTYLKFMVVLVVGIIVHELIHGLTWGLYAKSKFKSISFGVM